MVLNNTNHISLTFLKAIPDKGYELLPSLFLTHPFKVIYIHAVSTKEVHNIQLIPNNFYPKLAYVKFYCGAEF